MNKLLKLFVVVLLLAVPSLALADATYTTTNNIKGGNADYAFGGVVDQTNGYTQRIDSKGAAYVFEKAKTVAECIDSQDIAGGCSVLSGAGRLHTITVSSPSSSAGDYILVYDNTSASGTPKFDITVGTAKDTIHIVIPGGAIMSTGIYAVAGNAGSGDLVATFTYDN